MYKKDLFEYFKKNFSKNDLEGIMTRTRALYYLTEFFPQNTKYKAIKMLQSMRQREINNIIFNEIKLIEEKSAEKGIVPIHFKGLSLSDQLFGKNAGRLFGDIDLYIKHDDIIPFLHLIKELGYTTLGDKEIDPIGEEKNKNLVHLRPFHKKISDDYIIEIEIHTTPFFINAQASGLLSCEKLNEFFTYSQDYNLNDINIKVLSPEVNFLLLLDHFIKHILYQIVEMYYSKNEKGIEVLMSRLYEIKLFYEKYKDEICLETAKNIAEKYNSKMIIMLALKYLKEVFPDTDIYLWDEPLSINENPRFEDCLSFILMKNYTLADVIKNMKDDNFADEIYNKFDYLPGVYLRAPYKTPGISGEYFSISQQDIINKYGTHLFMGESPESPQELSLFGNISWDEKYLIINGRLNDINFPEEKGNLLTIYIDERTKKYPINMKTIFIRFLINKNNENKINDIFYYDLVLDGFGRISKKCNFSWSGGFGNGISFSLSIPWELLQITPYIGLKLGFNMHVANFKGYQIYRAMRLSGLDNRNIPFYFAEIELGDKVPYVFS